MNHEPVNPDDPQLTSYALGEMTLSERSEFEAKLDQSPSAQRELMELEEMMALLSKGLKNEWCQELKQPNLEVIAAATPVEEGKIVTSAQFSGAKRAFMGIAAALVALCMVGGILSMRQSGEQLASTTDVMMALPTDLAAPMELAATPATPGALSDIAVDRPALDVPQLVLADELDIEPVDLAAMVNGRQLPVDTSYLEAGSVVPVSHLHRGHMGQRNRVERVDSYHLPIDPSRMVSVGVIESRRVVARDEGGNSSARVFVRGYVTMDPSAPRDQVLAGFRPVSLSGNPMVRSEKDLQLISNFQSIQRDLEQVVKTLPEGSEARAELENLQERNQRALTELKQQFAH